jgi:hypothetical protein
LSNASPGASSMVPPSRVKASQSSTRRIWQCPPEASSSSRETAPRRSGAASGHDRPDGSPRSEACQAPSPAPSPSSRPTAPRRSGPGPRSRRSHPPPPAPHPPRASAASTAWSNLSAWARAAISGTTPPKRACRSACPITTEDRTRAPARPAQKRRCGVVATRLQAEDGDVFGSTGAVRCVVRRLRGR